MKSGVQGEAIKRPMKTGEEEERQGLASRLPPSSLRDKDSITFYS